MDTTHVHCQEVRDEFSALLDNELGAEEREAIEDHLAECSECLRALDKMKRVDDVFSHLEMKHAPADIEDGVHSALNKNVVAFPWRSVGATLVAAAAAVVVVVAMWPDRTSLSEGSFEMARSSAEVQAPASAPAPVMETLDSSVSRENFAEEEMLDSAEFAAETPTESSDIAAGLGSRQFENSAARPESIGLAEQRVAADAIASDAPPFQDQFEQEEVRSEFRASSIPEEADAVATRGTVDGEAAANLRREIGRNEEVAVAENRALAASPPPAAEPAPIVAASEASPTRAKATAPLDARRFETRDGVLYEVGYAGQDIVELERDSQTTRDLIEQDPRVAELLEQTARCVFNIDGVWYGFAAVE